MPWVPIRLFAERLALFRAADSPVDKISSGEEKLEISLEESVRSLCQGSRDMTNSETLPRSFRCDRSRGMEGYYRLSRLHF